jgi:hypothetical protein
MLCATKNLPSRHLRDGSTQVGQLPISQTGHVPFAIPTFPVRELRKLYKLGGHTGDAIAREIALYCRAMALYQVPKHNPYQRTLRILSGGAIFSLLGILLFSLFEPAGLSDSIAHSMGWAAGVIMVASVLGLTLLSVKEGTWKLKRKLRFEVSDGKIIQSSDDFAAVEISLNNIKSLHEYPGGMLIRGGEPRRQISVPREINDFEALKRDLTSYHPITVLRAKLYLFSFLAVLFMIVAWFLVLTSHARRVVLVAGLAALGLQALGAYSLLATLRGKTSPKFVALMLVFTWLLMAGIVFQRVISAL